MCVWGGEGAGRALQVLSWCPGPVQGSVSLVLSTVFCYPPPPVPVGGGGLPHGHLARVPSPPLSLSRGYPLFRSLGWDSPSLGFLWVERGVGGIPLAFSRVPPVSTPWSLGQGTPLLLDRQTCVKVLSSLFLMRVVKTQIYTAHETHLWRSACLLFSRQLTLLLSFGEADPVPSPYLRETHVFVNPLKRLIVD